MTDDVQRSSSRMRFPGISPRAYEHPVDRGALATLRTVPGFPAVLKAVAGAWSERGERLMALASSIRVGPSQYPALDRIRNECAETLDLDTVPEVFVAANPVLGAVTIGMDEPFVVLNTGLVEALDEEGLRFAVGHELGHVLSGHAVYRTMLLRLINIQNSMGWLPVGYWGIRAIIAALLEWFRKAELSCDRAGLLCGQDPSAALRVHLMLAGGLDPSQVDIPSFLRQASEYESVEDVRDSLLKLKYVTDLSHPLAVVRAAELQKWAASEEYRAILAGDYPRRDADEPTSAWSQDVKSAARSYKESWSASTDPLAKVLGDVGGAISGVADKVFGRFSSTQDDEPGQ